jgi:hypothetical protein
MPDSFNGAMARDLVQGESVNVVSLFGFMRCMRQRRRLVGECWYE